MAHGALLMTYQLLFSAIVAKKLTPLEQLAANNAAL